MFFCCGFGGDLAAAPLALGAALTFGKLPSGQQQLSEQLPSGQKVPLLKLLMLPASGHQKPRNIEEALNWSWLPHRVSSSDRTG